jgi:hypothetical protein
MNQSEFFAKHGYAYIKNVLTPEQCDNFSKIMLDMKNSNILRYEGAVDSYHYKESYGGNHNDFEAALREVTPRMEEELGVKLKPANSFARIYYNGGTLPPHRDRQGLDYTLSITLSSTLSFEWPLWCTDKLGNQVPIFIHKGDGGMMLGTSMDHWRTPLVCDPEQYAIQMFMHWSFS